MKLLMDTVPGELVYTYTVVYNDEYDPWTHTVSTAWHLQPSSPLFIIERVGEMVRVICEQGIVEMHHSIGVTEEPDAD
jgi:predicted GH43/DUF377 family glycosyl hydrolase